VLGGSFEHKEGGGGGGMATKLLRQGGKVRGRKAQSEGFRVEGRGARREKKIREKRWDFSLVKSSVPHTRGRYAFDDTHGTRATGRVALGTKAGGGARAVPEERGDPGKSLPTSCAGPARPKALG